MSSFHHYARRVVDPNLSLDRRRYALGECLRKLGTITLQGKEFGVHRQAVREKFNHRFGFDDPGATVDQLVAAVIVAQAQYNQLCEARRVLWKRRAVQKARGTRAASAHERLAARQFWNTALLRVMQLFD